MIDVFFGGIGFHPAGLDYTDETCSHGCAYCFASINKEDRGGSIKAAINALYNKSDSLKSQLIQRGYPICVSNRTDIFAKNNKKNATALFTHLAESKNGVFIQTKGGDEFEQYYEILNGKKDVAVYISITMIDEEKSKRIECAAPLPKRRLEIAKWLISKGVHVIAALNPLSIDWLPKDELEQLIKEFHLAGIKYVVVEPLDMSDKRIRNMNVNRLKRIQDGVDNRDTLKDYMRYAVGRLIAEGFHVGKKGMPFRSDFFDDLGKIYKRSMPAYQTLINYCLDNKKTAITFSEFQSVCYRGDDFYFKEFITNDIRGYLLRTGFDTWKENQRVSSFNQLFRIAWNDKRTKLSLQNHLLISPTGEFDENGDAILNFKFKGAT